MSQTVTNPQPAQASGTTTSTTEVKVDTAAKRQKITDRVVQVLKTLPENATMTRSEINAQMPEVSDKTLQPTLSTLVRSKRIEKVKTGRRQPGYKVPSTPTKA